MKRSHADRKSHALNAVQAVFRCDEILGAIRQFVDHDNGLAQRIDILHKRSGAWVLDRVMQMNLLVASSKA